MTLTRRLTLFFLATLGTVLIGFSAGLYALARWYLYADRTDHLNAALHTLVAAAEIDPAGVEWDQKERRVSLGLGRQRDPFRWKVADDIGHVIDGSPSAATDPILGQAPPVREVGVRPKQVVQHQGETWWMLERRLLAGPKGSQPTHEEREDVDPDEPPKYPALVMTVAVSIEPVKETLRLLAIVSAGLSTGLWLVVALASRKVCRRALGPMIDMAEKARGINASELHERLPHPGTCDEVEHLCRAFNDLLSRLEESFARQQRFTGDASHQLRTPLTAMLGQLEVALRRGRSSGEYRQVIEAVHGQADQLRHIVEMLLFLARADSEAKLPHLEAIDLSAWLPEHLEAWSSHGRAADLRIECPRGEPLLIEAQAPLLGQMLDNLLDNAFKYSQPGSPVTLRVQARAEMDRGKLPSARSRGEGQGEGSLPDSTMISITVEDAGPGIPPDDLPHVFDPFYRSPDARRRGLAGSGLGLAVAQRIAAAFGGLIRAESIAQQGSRFTILLRRVRTNESDQPVAKPSLQASPEMETFTR